MGTPTAVAIYARISSDDGTALGVKRQVADCRKLARELGWVVAEEYVDNDVSAYSGKRNRPAYERMLADLRDGARDGVLVYHVDRLTRRPLEVEQFVEVMSAANVRHVRFAVGGDLDVGNGDGLLMLRVMAAVAANESATKSRRVRRKMDEVAAAGLPHGGPNRPFGYRDDKMTIDPAEAAIVRTLVARFLAGESTRSLALWLNEQGVRTVMGNPWRTPTVRAILASGRIAGLREQRGQVVGPAAWAPIITQEERQRILALMEQKKTSGQRTPRRYLLTGLLRCGKCDHTLYSSPRKNTRRYVCLSGPDHQGCGRLTVVAGPLEELVTRAVLVRLDSKDMARALKGKRSEDKEATALAESVAADRAQLEELAAMWATKEFTAAEWMKARKVIEERVATNQRRLDRMTRNDALAGVVGNGAVLREQWADLTLERQATIVKAVVDRVVIAAGSPSARELDPGRVEIVWRV